MLFISQIVLQLPGHQHFRIGGWQHGQKMVKLKNAPSLCTVMGKITKCGHKTDIENCWTIGRTKLKFRSWLVPVDYFFEVLVLAKAVLPKKS